MSDPEGEEQMDLTTNDNKASFAARERTLDTKFPQGTKVKIVELHPVPPEFREEHLPDNAVIGQDGVVLTSEVYKEDKITRVLVRVLDTNYYFKPEELEVIEKHNSKAVEPSIVKPKVIYVMGDLQNTLAVGEAVERLIADKAVVLREKKGETLRILLSDLLEKEEQTIESLDEALSVASTMQAPGIVQTLTEIVEQKKELRDTLPSLIAMLK